MADIALGVIPIFFSACQGFVVLLDKIHLLRHYKKEILWLRLKVSVQSKCYKSELHRLVIATLDTHKAQSLINDDNHSEWKSPNLERIFKKYMGPYFLDFLSAVQLIHEALASIQNKLDAFAPPDIHSPRFRAIKDQFKLAFNKDKYTEDIENLKEMIAELKRVRELAADMESAERAAETKSRLAKERRARIAPAPDIGHYETVGQYKSIRSLSSAFQDFLQHQWSCCSPSHSHSGRLFLTSALKPQPSVLLLLESDGQEGPTARRKNRLFFKVWSQPPGLLTPDSETPLETPRSPKRQRLSPQPSSTHARVHPQAQRASQETTDSAMKSLCKELERLSLQSKPRNQQPLIRVDTQNREFYRFDPVAPLQVLPPGAPAAKLTWDIHKIEFHPLSRLLDRKPPPGLLDRQLVQLAATLVRCTLMGYSTAGWPRHRPPSSGCILEGTSFLIQAGVESISSGVTIDALLNTLNIPVDVGSGIGPNSISSSSDTAMTDAGDSEQKGNKDETTETANDEQAYLKVGVRNLVLYRLGVALLSIGRWERIQWQDVVSVRRKAAVLKWGGEAYRTAVQSLIDCDFGVGADLETEKLQFEVLRRVVAPLEKSVEIVSASIEGGGFLSSGNVAQIATGEGWLEGSDDVVAYEPHDNLSSGNWMAGSPEWAWPPIEADDTRETDVQAICVSPS